MRVLYFIYTLEGGGAERQLKYLLNGHSNHIERAVCYVDPSGAEQLQDDVDRFHVPRKHPLDFRWQPITKLIKAWRPDIVVNWLPYVVMHTLIPAWKADVPVFVSALRNTHKLTSRRELQRWIHHWGADAMTSNTNPAEQSVAYRMLCQHKPFKWVPNGFDIQCIENAPPADLTQFGLRPDIPTLLFVGRLTRHKNPIVLIKMMEQLRNDGTEAQLLICGDGYQKEKLSKHIVETGQSETIHLTGYRSDVFNLMKAATLLVHPSKREGLPNVLIEGMAAGLPIVASSIPVHQRWVVEGENGLTAAPDDHVQLAHHVQTVLSDEPLRNALVAAGRETAAQLTIPKMIQSYESWYATLLKT